MGVRPGGPRHGTAIARCHAQQFMLSKIMLSKTFFFRRSQTRHAVLLGMAFATASILLAQPSISSGGIVNVSGYLPTLAPNVVFAVFGQNLGPATIVVASAPN